MNVRKRIFQPIKKNNKSKDIKDLMMQLKFKMNNSSSNAGDSEEEPAQLSRRIRTPSFENKIIEKEKATDGAESTNIQQEIHNMIS